MANVLCLGGRLDEADGWCSLAAELGASDDIITQASWRTARARLLVHEGKLGNAEELAREAVRLMEGTDALAGKARFFLDLAAILQAAGKPAEAVEAVERAIELFDRKGSAVGARRARGQLAELVFS